MHRPVSRHKVGATASRGRADARRAGRRRLRLFTSERFTEDLALYRRLGYRETGREDYLGRILVRLQKPLDEALAELG